MKALNEYPTPRVDGFIDRGAHASGLIDFARTLERENAALREALEQIALDRKLVSIPCSDPQCGDSTWDHECDATSEDRPTTAAEIARAVLDATKP